MCPFFWELRGELGKRIAKRSEAKPFGGMRHKLVQFLRSHRIFIGPHLLDNMWKQRANNNLPFGVDR